MMGVGVVLAEGFAAARRERVRRACAPEVVAISVDASTPSMSINAKSLRVASGN
jgi:hypothetical protein